MRLLRQYKQWSLLPAALWLGMQLAMAMGFSIAAPAVAGKAPPQLAPLVAGLDIAEWLCTAPGESVPGPDDPAHALSPECYWCQGFGAMPEPASRPEPLPPCEAPGLANQPLAHQTPPVTGSRLTGFRSRAPPV